ncbi:MAG: glycosyltransferase family 4 protein, partial [Nitrososphaeraceae archaeon]
VHEQTIAPFYIERQLLQNEEEKFPSWIANKLNYDTPVVEDYISKELEELVISDRIFCASDFVKKSILSCNKNINTDKIKVVPYGVDLIDNFNSIKIEKLQQAKIRVLTVGTVGIRKGHPYIIEAAKKLKDIAEFRVIGDHSMVPPAVISSVSENVTFLGQIPRQDVADNYQWADVFLLPSICEGSATVTYEALISGLPIIVTPNTGSVIENDKHGFIIPVSDTDAICDKIEELYNHSDKLNYFKENIFQLKMFLSKEGYKNRFISNL